MKVLQALYAEGEIDLASLVQRLQSWEAHLKHGDTYRLRRKAFDAYTFRRKSVMEEENSLTEEEEYGS